MATGDLKIRLRGTYIRNWHKFEKGILGPREGKILERRKDRERSIRDVGYHSRVKKRSRDQPAQTREDMKKGTQQHSIGKKEADRGPAKLEYLSLPFPTPHHKKWLQTRGGGLLRLKSADFLFSCEGNTAGDKGGRGKGTTKS